MKTLAVGLSLCLAWSAAAPAFAQVVTDAPAAVTAAPSLSVLPALPASAPAAPQTASSFNLASLSAQPLSGLTPLTLARPATIAAAPVQASASAAHGAARSLEALRRVGSGLSAKEDGESRAGAWLRKLYVEAMQEGGSVDVPGGAEGAGLPSRAMHPYRSAARPAPAGLDVPAARRLVDAAGDAGAFVSLSRRARLESDAASLLETPHLLVDRSLRRAIDGLAAQAIRRNEPEETGLRAVLVRLSHAAEAAHPLRERLEEEAGNRRLVHALYVDMDSALLMRLIVGLPFGALLYAFMHMPGPGAMVVSALGAAVVAVDLSLLILSLLLLQDRSSLRRRYDAARKLADDHREDRKVIDPPPPVRRRVRVAAKEEPKKRISAEAREDGLSLDDTDAVDGQDAPARRLKAKVIRPDGQE